MTSEIVILNRNGVAIAADSAQLCSVIKPDSNIENKIYTSVDKIFEIPNHKICVLTYNGARLSGVPVETIINNYAEHVANKKMGTLSKYAEEFINYMENDKRMLSLPDTHFITLVTICMGDLYNNVINTVNGRNENSDDKIVNVIEEKIDQYYNIIASAKKVREIKEQWHRHLTSKYGSDYKTVSIIHLMNI